MIYIYFVIGLAVSVLYLYWRNKVRIAQLGDCLFEVDSSEFQKTILAIVALRIAIGSLGVFLVGTFNDRPLIARALFLIFFGQMIASEIVTLLMFREKTGVYQNGIIANTGCKLYQEISYFYEIVKEQNYIYLFSFSPKVFVYKQARLYMNYSDRNNARKILSKKIEFDTERKGLRKI